jgi:hypothetical protein
MKGAKQKKKKKFNRKTHVRELNIRSNDRDPDLALFSQEDLEQNMYRTPI